MALLVTTASLSMTGLLTTQLRAYAFMHAAGLTPLLSRFPQPKPKDMLPFPPSDQAIDCTALPGTPLTVLVLGQSNAANTAGTPLPPAHLSGQPPVSESYSFNLLNGECHPLRAPLQGVFGNGSSAWPSFAQQLRREINQSVIIASGAVGSSTVGQWRESNPFAERPPLAAWLELLSRRLMGTLGEPDLVLWFQGENDAILETPRQDYENAFLEVRQRLRDAGIAAPILMSTTSVCRAPAAPAVRAAQQHLIDSLDDVHAGPDTDTIPRGAEYRRDGCHFTAAAIRKVGRLFARSALESGLLAGQ